MLALVDRARDRWRWFDVALAVVGRGKRVGATRLAAVIAYYGFFSLFPLLLVLVTVVAEVFDGKEASDIVDSVIAQIPVVGADLANAQAISGNTFAVLVGLAGALWAGTHAIDAVDQAMEIVWSGEAARIRGMVARRVRAVAVLGVLGVAVLVATGVGTAVASAPAVAGEARPLLLVPTAAINTAVMILTFKITAPGRTTWRRHLPGAIAGGIGFTILQTVGGLYVTTVVNGASDTYGVFAVVIGLLSWLHVQARLLVWSALVNAELYERHQVPFRDHDA